MCVRALAHRGRGRALEGRVREARSITTIGSPSRVRPPRGLVPPRETQGRPKQLPIPGYTIH
jgi:hypothetical protein